MRPVSALVALIGLSMGGMMVAMRRMGPMVLTEEPQREPVPVLPPVVPLAETPVPAPAPVSYNPRLSFREQIGRAESLIEVGSLLHHVEQIPGVSTQTLKKCRREAAVRIEELTKPFPY